MHYDLMTGLYVYPVSFDSALLTTLCNSNSEKIEIHSVETVSEISQKLKANFVKHQFLTVLKNSSENISRRKTTRVFAPPPVSTNIITPI